MNKINKGIKSELKDKEKEIEEMQSKLEVV